MQPYKVFLNIDENYCFSIHKRIEGGATLHPPQARKSYLWFQYPQADRRGCNLAAETPIHQTSQFQYPQADRRGCNFSYACQNSFISRRFSIHKRIEGGATGRQPSPKKNQPLVSVSTSGSKGVQPPPPRLATWLRCVSVSTSGSKGVQQCDFSRGHVRPRLFQYPQADRRGCNEEDPNDVFFKTKFQYPQADRRGCNWERLDIPASYLEVSVSTSGSKGVQHITGVHATNPSNRGFSIHKRIEGGATLDDIEQWVFWLRFSIHKRIEGGATRSTLPVRRNRLTFQYPQADRRGCNFLQ
mgnify:CR=1 FL=1